MSLFDRVLQHLNFGVAAADSILQLNLHAELVGLEVIILSSFFGDGFQKLVDEVDGWSLSEGGEGRLRD